MTRLVAKLKTSRNAYKLEVKGKLELPYAGRQLPKGESLRSGDLATGEDGHVYEIVARPEKLLHIDCPAPREAAIVGYVLGNGHVPAQIGKGFVRIVHVPELEQAFPSLGVKVSQVEAPFEPDLGQAQGHRHHHRDDHDHGHDHGQDHHHHHKHD
jgi:urease accessory protein